MIRNIREAYQLFKEILRQKSGQILRVYPMNFSRHRLIHAKIYYRGMPINVKFYLVFQKKPFEKFEKYYNFPSKAFTVNLSILEYLIKNDIDRIVFIDENANAYMISPKTFYKIASNKGWIRKTKKTSETVVHIPISLLNRIEYEERNQKITKFI